MKPNDRIAVTAQRKAPRRKFLLALAMVVLGQLSLLAHLHDINDAHSNECLICTQLHQQGHGLTGAGLVFPALLPESFPVVLRIADAAASSHDSPNARAPPNAHLA
jgi:hypothetical protein